MKGQRIRIKLQGFDYQVLDQSALEIVETAKRSGPAFRPDSAADPHRASVP